MIKLNTKRTLIVAIAVLGLVAVPAVRVIAQEDDTDTTVINANIGSTISITSGPAVNLGIVPVSGGAQTSASDTVTVATNNSSGFFLTLENDDANTDLVNGANTIAAHTGTHGTPTALANNTWGYAVPGGDFDSSYTVITNATTSATLWAGVPANGTPVTLKTTAGPASPDDVTTVWYSAKADTTKPDGTYTDTVLYTATTNL